MASEVAPCMPLGGLFRRAPPGRRPRPVEVCRRLVEGLNALGAGAAADAAAQRPAEDHVAGATGSSSSGAAATGDAPAPREQARHGLSEDVQKQLQAALEILDDSAGASSQGGDHSHREGACELLAQMLVADLPTLLVAALPELEFEVRKDVISVFSALVRLAPQLGADQQITEYAEKHPRFFELLVEGYARPEVATHCGMMLRSCARHPQLTRALMERPKVALKLLSYTRNPSFDISSDAFSSLHDFMLTHKAESAKFVEEHFREFFRDYNGLLESEDYVTQRQALKLLSEMLLDRTFMRVMLSYIGDETYLQIHMNLLRADSKAIQFEAFHVFKIFVANPYKPPKVCHILYKNKDRLVKLLETLRASRPDDRQFAEDKSTVIGKLQSLEPPPKVAPGGGGGSAPGRASADAVPGAGAPRSAGEASVGGGSAGCRAK